MVLHCIFIKKPLDVCKKSPPPYGAKNQQIKTWILRRDVSIILPVGGGGGVIIRKSGLLWFFFFRTEPMLSRVITLPNRVGSPKGSLSSSLCLRCAFLCILQSMQLRHL